MAGYKKIISFVFCFFILFTSSLKAEVVNKIIAEGNDRISLETIIVFGDISIGKDYGVSDVKELIKKLYDTSFFAEISVTIKDNVLNILVKENPIIKSVIYDGEKAKKYIEKIEDLLVLKENSPFVENNIKKDINLLKEFYRSLGFYFVKIDAEVINL